MIIRYMILIAALLGASLAGAQEKKRGNRASGPGKAGRTFAQGASRVYVQTLIRTFDTNRNSTIEEQELEKGFLEMLDQFDAQRKVLLKQFDRDKDGIFDKKESQAVREFLFAALGVLLHDSNQDWKVDDPEGDEAWDDLVDSVPRHNRGIIAKFDTNKNGELDPGEAEAARKRLQNWQKGK